MSHDRDKKTSNLSLLSILEGLLIHQCSVKFLLSRKSDCDTSINTNDYEAFRQVRYENHDGWKAP